MKPNLQFHLEQPIREGRSVFEHLKGRWHQVRTIEPGGHYVGEAEFSPIAPGFLRYTEEGTLTPQGASPVRSRRSYIYAIDGDTVSVYFDENPPRLFHRIELDPNHTSHFVSTESRHLCGADDYRSTYEFKPDGTFVVRHRVIGPRKNYVMTTTYTSL